MNLTLGVLASVLALLPGLALIAVFNFRTRRGGARRPEMPLTAVTALVLAVFFSILLHGASYLIVECMTAFGQAFYQKTEIAIGPVIRNPLVAGFDGLGGKPMDPKEGLGLLVVLFLEVIAIVVFTISQGFQLLVDPVDYNAQGWVFEHITRPAENGYTPVGHVYTSTMSGRYGIAYKGAITDLRQDEKGQVLSIALSRPERFLYEIGKADNSSSSFPKPRSWGATRPKPLNDMSVKHHARENVGGIVALDSRVINNIVVHSISNSLLKEIDNNLPELPVEEGQ